MKIAEQAASYAIEKVAGSALPFSHQPLNVNALVSIFRHTTNSYKPLFFLALLNKLKTQTDNDVFTFDELAVEMLVLAWYPLNFFHLSLGKQDQIGKMVSELNMPRMKYSITHPSFQQELYRLIQQQKNTINVASLMRYVPYRLLTPFFSQQLVGISDSKKNGIIAELANKNFSENNSENSSENIALYRFIEKEGQQAIQINTYWEHYLRTNFKIVYSWVLWKWSNYLQTRNPNTPAILHKIMPPSTRQTLTSQTTVWKEAMTAGMAVNCIYTGETLQNKAFALDHFLPWSYVCHNQLWNLTPVTCRVNSKKSNYLPPKESISLLAEQQHQLIVLTATIYSTRKWHQLLASHMNDLHLDEKDLLSKQKLHQAYQNTLKPLLALARQTGFKEMTGITELN